MAKKTTATLDDEIASLATEDDQSVLDEAATEEIHGETFSISSYGADYTVDGLVKRMKSGAFYVPPFQRSYVWNQRQASRFIESLLMGLPVPGLFVFKESESARHLIVDGQQRLKTLQFFYDGTFRERKFRLLDVNKTWAGKTYDELVEDDRIRLDDAIIHTTIFKQDQPQDDKTSIYEVFERINTGGVKLSAQEIRACVSSGALVDLLRLLNEVDAWREIYGPKSERLKDEELILRFLALATDRKNYKRPMRRFLNRFSDDNANLGKVDKMRLQNLFISAIQLINAALGKQAFRPERQLNAAVYDAVMVGVANRIASKSSPPDLKKIQTSYDALLKSEDFRSSYMRSTADGEQVSKRIDLAIKAFASA
jgi:hypothetical protein